MLPDPRVLPHRPVPAARHVAQDPVKQELVLLLRGDARLRARGERRELGRDLDRGEDRRVEVRDHQRGGGQPRGLVDEEVRALVVRVVRDEQPGGDRGGGDGVVRVQRFEQLRGLWGDQGVRGRACFTECAP